MARAKIVSFINYKGGVGKTTSTYHIGCSLAQHHNKKVLLLDIDPQTNLTFLCASVERWEAFRKKYGTIKNIYKNYCEKKAIDVKRYIWKEPISTDHGNIKNLDLIPCDIELLGEDIGGGQISGCHNPMEAIRKNSEVFIRDRSFIKIALREIEQDYDYILIDCPPNLYQMTQNALFASKWYIIPAIPDHLSTIGLSILQEKIVKIGEHLKAAFVFKNETSKFLGISKLGGIIFVKVRLGGTILVLAHENIMSKIRHDHPDACFEEHTTEMIGYGEAAESARPVWENRTANSIRAAKKNEYTSITSEFVRRIC
jgi:chromosome partitioning protein